VKIDVTFSSNVLGEGRYSTKFVKCFKYITPQDITTKNRYDMLSQTQSLSGNGQGKFSGKTYFTTSPRYTIQKAPLQNSESKLENSATSKCVRQKRSNVKNVKEKNRKIIILGDSHARGLSGKLKDILRDEFEVTGYSQPNCNSKSLIASAQADIAKLATKDVLFFF